MLTEETVMTRVFVSLLLGLTVVAAPASAQDYPSKPITVIIPYGTGGGTDLTMRLVEESASRKLGQKLVLVNRPGGAGVAGHFQLTKAAPDGYTLAIVGLGSTAVQPHMSKVGYERGDYVGVVQVNTIPFLLVTGPQSQFKDMKQVIEFAKKNPAGRVKVGITARGSWLHLVMLQLEQLHGVKFTYVPHTSTGEVVVSLMGGHIDIGNADLPSAQTKVIAGELRGIGIWTAERSPDMPNVPTLKEQGTNLEGGFYNIIIAPKGTPADIVKKIDQAFKEAMTDQETIKRAKQAGVSFNYLGNAASEKAIDESYDLAGKLLKEVEANK